MCWARSHMNEAGPTILPAAVPRVHSERQQATGIVRGTPRSEYQSPGRICATHACGIWAAATVEITRS